MYLTYRNTISITPVATKAPSRNTATATIINVPVPIAAAVELDAALLDDVLSGRPVVANSFGPVCSQKAT